MNNPLVSIIIPTYNRAHFIGETLESVIAQSCPNWECIVIDDGSSDYTDELMEFYCEKDSRIQYHHRPSNKPKGANACRNYGFDLSKGEYVNWFDSDDVYDLDCLKNILSLIKFKEKIDIIIVPYQFIDNLGKKGTLITLELPFNDLYKDYALWNLKIITGSLWIKKSFLIDEEYLFDTNILRGQETEFFLRLFFDKKINFHLVEAVSFYYRKHNNSKSFEDQVFNENFQMSVAKIYCDNYEKVFSYNDIKLLKYYHKRTVSFWFRGLDYKSKLVRNYISQRLFSIYKRRIFFRLKFKLIFEIHEVYGKRIFKLVNYLKNQY